MKRNSFQSEVTINTNYKFEIRELKEKNAPSTNDVVECLYSNFFSDFLAFLELGYEFGSKSNYTDSFSLKNFPSCFLI